MQHTRIFPSLIVCACLSHQTMLAQQAPTQPAIQLDSIPAFGVLPAVVSGTVAGVDPTKYRVAPLIFLSGLGWFSKETCASTSVGLSALSHFEATVTSGGADQFFSRLALYVVPATFQVACSIGVAGPPADLVASSVARIIVYRPDPNEKDISFAKQSFAVKAATVPVGPGPCVYSDSPGNVFVDSQGQLHLRLTNTANTWNCSEVYSRAAVGFGRYKWTLPAFPKLAPSVVFGAFLWQDGELDPLEIDVEFGFSSVGDTTDAQYVVAPSSQPGHLKRIAVPNTGPITFVMSWTPDALTFQGFAGQDDTGTPFASWTYPSAPPVASGTYQNFRFNVWINGPAPTDNQTEEVIISGFDYQPLAPSTAIPEITAVASPAGYDASASPQAPLTIFGNNLSNQADSPATSIPLPFAMADVAVEVNGLPAPQYFTSKTQVNLQIPAKAPLGSSLISVTRSGQPSLKYAFRNSVAAPGIFTLPSGCLAQNEDFSINTAQRPSKSGSVLVLYLAGIGPVDNAIPDGAAAPLSPLSRALLASGATIGGQSAVVEFLGSAPGFVGIAQANIRVPEGVTPGARQLAISVGGKVSNSCAVFIGSEPLMSAPVLQSIAPPLGPPSGGTQVNLTGTGFQSGASVRFGQTPAASVSFVSPMIVQVVSPAGSGIVPITLINPDGQSTTLPAAFTYQAPAPVLQSIAPPLGPPSGGTQVNLTGTGFQSGASVRFGQTPAASVSFVSPMIVRVVSPAGSGIVPITLINPDGQSTTLPAAFTYQAVVVGPNPKITGLIQQNRIVGTVSGVSPPDGFKVALFAFTTSYFVQPCTFEKLNPIFPNGSWGPIDSHNGTIYAFLVSSTYDPPDNPAVLPAVDHVNIFAATGAIGTISGTDVARCPAM